VLTEYAVYYSQARPHQGLAQQSPIPKLMPAADELVHCLNVRGGIVHDYYRTAA